MIHFTSIGRLRAPGRLRRVALAAALATGSSTAVQAQTSAAATPQTIVITAPAVKPLTRITEDAAALPAAVTVINKSELDRRTINTYGDILRGVTGFSVFDYGQGLVAYGVQVRGFDEGHGRNIAVALDGMPLNVTGSQHTNGYADQAQLIPELLDRVEIVRGPFSVLSGNHAVGGAIQYTTDARRESSFKATVDSFGRVRLLPIASFDVGPGRALIALDATKGSAYNDQSDIQRLNLFTRYSMPLAGGLASVRVQAYDADAESPGYLDRQRVQSGEIRRRSALARGIGDAKTQGNVVLNFRSDDAEGSGGVGDLSGGWFASAYLNRDIRKRFTQYDLTLPPNSVVPLGAERDKLLQAGIDLRKTSRFNLGSMPAQWLVGVQLNDERIDALNYASDPDHDLLPVTPARPDVFGVDRRVQTTTHALLTQLQLQPLPALKLTLGLRYDRLRFDVRLHPQDDTYDTAVASGTPVAIARTSSQASPKLGLAYALYESPRQRVDFFANAARGFKSPYAFSDFYANVDTGLAAGRPGTVPALSISPLRSYEAGLQGGAADGSQSWRVSGWSTRQDDEATRNAAGFLQSFKRTRRSGFDVEGAVAIADSTRVFANLSHVRARIDAPLTTGEDRIPNVPRITASLGLSSIVASGVGPLALSLVDNYVGAAPITSDGSIQSHAYHRLTARAELPVALRPGASVSFDLVGYSRRSEEPAFDFGGGVVGITPKPRLRATVGLQVPL